MTKSKTGRAAPKKSKKPKLKPGAAVAVRKMTDVAETLESKALKINGNIARAKQLVEEMDEVINDKL